jgi:hypothetical protein
LVVGAQHPPDGRTALFGDVPHARPRLEGLITSGSKPLQRQEAGGAGRRRRSCAWGTRD